jgi:hypothetical protein
MSFFERILYICVHWKEGTKLKKTKRLRPIFYNSPLCVIAFSSERSYAQPQKVLIEKVFGFDTK